MFQFLAGLIPGAVKAIGGFLGGAAVKKGVDSLMGGAGSALGSSLVSKGMNALTGGNPGRMSFDDWKHQQGLLDYANPLEINRQRTFLQEMAPAQAAAYNTYQDATFGNETERQIGRIQQTGTALGMSPWEVMGQGGAAPAPAVMNTPQRTDPGSTLAALMPLKIAEMNNKTALAQTAMQTDSAQRIAAQQTAEGQLPQAQVLATQAAQYASLESATRLQSQTMLDRIRLAYDALPRDKQDMIVSTFESRPGYENIIKLLDMFTAGAKEEQWKDAWFDLGVKQQSTIASEVAQAMKLFGAGAGAIGTVLGGAKTVADIFKKKSTTINNTRNTMQYFERK